ncbi:DUF2188 domain-containing protein [Fibrella forsythiae]|uniref:DUF2188 domain-containing protein n=1 Tax=Fibrella forsythiae TaxID=2817061 RepID=A0ABS3JF27_9BACT|nr:DUF2188 domain-containing protein [Fibrella forsythiae]MBO0947507.1 DUF2188 domain-containing protein [Fibrella forsythiae]
MARVVYYVVTSGNKWKVIYNSKDYGPYDTQAKAIKVAVDAAHGAGENGHDAQVRVQGADSQWRTEWTYGNDPYPPKG